ncbi:hypothetical protein J4Q44_G00094560 [Coregonus suidteri]|uniref:Uncharacterized protein n=1 Tax=Coregonus suidteri TaxID=861788 RepID=A0AAN8M282_9TELE
MEKSVRQRSLQSPSTSILSSSSMICTLIISGLQIKEKQMMYLKEICRYLNIPGSNPQRFVPHRCLSTYDVSISTHRMLPAYKVLYYGFLSNDDQELYKDPLEHIYKEHHVSKKAQARIKSLHEDLNRKGMTQQGKN